jgi:tetratricopeptide (TPR) repeat protein
MKPKGTDAWEAAEWEYSSLHATRMMPLPGMSPSPDELTEGLAEIVRTCPKFYPAVLELGIRKLARGAGAAEEKRILKGVRLMLEVGDPEHLDEEIGLLIDNLENIWRYDVAKRCLELLVERHPQKALFRDYLAHDLAKLGDVTAALHQANQAVAMAPDNPFFRCNLGLFHLMAGSADEARTHLTAAHRLDPDNEVTRGNLVILDYISEHGGNFFDYLLRPVDEDEIAGLEDEEDFEDLDHLCNSYNGDRMAAFGQNLACDADKRARCADTIGTLTIFFDFVDQVANMAGFLNERLAFVHQHFNAIMHKFIFKFGDVDRAMIEDVCGSLLEYYGFLERAGLVPSDELEEFQTLVRSSKQELLEKMERYNEIRHNDDVDEEQKEAIREKLFEGDHAWPHL